MSKVNGKDKIEYAKEVVAFLSRFYDIPIPEVIESEWSPEFRHDKIALALTLEEESLSTFLEEQVLHEYYHYLWYAMSKNFFDMSLHEKFLSKDKHVIAPLFESQEAGAVAFAKYWAILILKWKVMEIKPEQWKIKMVEEKEEKFVEDKKPETELPEGVVLVKFTMKDEKNAEGLETIFEAIINGGHEFRSAVHMKEMFRCVMYEKGWKIGSPIVLYAIHEDMAWSVQQTVDWAYLKEIDVVAVRREGREVEVGYIKLGIKAPPPKEKAIYAFRKVDGWKLGKIQEK